MKKLLLALAFLASFTGFAEAQCNGTFANNTACGNISGANNLPRAIPLSSFPAGNPPGGSTGQQQYNNGGVFGGFTQSGAVTVNTTTGLSTLSANAIPVLPSRAVAATLNLSAFTSITTLGYTTPGDGGGATYYNYSTGIITFTISTPGTCTNGAWPGVKFNGGSGKGFAATVTCAGGVATVVTPIGAGSRGNGYVVGNVLTATCNNIGGCGVPPSITVSTVGNGAFIDSFTSSLTIQTAGASCTNGTYNGTQPYKDGVVGAGGTGARLMGTATIAGGALTSFVQTTPGGGYRVGELLTLGAIPGCATFPVLQVATTTTPLASFTDSAGIAWQYAPPDNINVKQFGAIADAVAGQTDPDWIDNGPAFRAALQYASIGNGEADVAAGYHGQTVFVPQGAFKVCGGIVIYEYTKLQGADWGATSLKQCNSDGAAVNFVTLGDSASQLGNFENKIWDITLFGGFNSGSAYVIYSNNAQSGDAISRVVIYGVSRGCIKYDTGWGGQSMFGIHGVGCVPNSTYFTSGGAAMDLSGNFGFTIDGQSFIAGTSGLQMGVRFGDGGTARVDALHCEGAIVNCVSVNGAGTSPPQVTIIGLLGPATNLLRIETGSIANYVTLINSRASGAPCTVYNQGTATCVKTGAQLGLATY